MNTSTLNRSVLVAVIGTVLAAGAVAPANAQAWRPRQDAQDASSSSAQQGSDSRENRKEREAAAKKEREDAESARQDANRQREQAQRDRQLTDQREQQERIREQNRETRDRNEQVQAPRVQAREPRDPTGRQADGLADRQQREERRDDVADARDRQQHDRQDRQQDRQGDRQDPRDQRQQDRAGRDNDQRQQDRAGRDTDQRHADLPPPRRLENRQRDQRIVHERQQAQTYQQAIQTRIAPQAKYYAETLNHQHRSHGYHYQQQYYWRLMQMFAAWNWSSYNYYNDPYFYTADDYRYYRGGSWYSINRYGADILRQAVNYGYQEGLYAGRADEQDGWRFDYRGAWVYRDANYGYRGFYVNQGEYNYYFREGFRRGYEDGYYQRYRYGHSYNGSDVILGTVLSGILNLQAYRW